MGTTTVTVTVNDGTSDTNTSFTLNITNTNDIPTSSNASFTTDEDVAKSFTSDDFNFTDIDTPYGDSLNSIFITSLPSRGTLTFYDVNVVLNEEITNIERLKFTPVSNANGTTYTTFGFKVNDGEANSTAAYTAVVNVTSVDDAPSIETITTQNILEDSSPITIALKMSDIENDVTHPGVSISNEDLATLLITKEFSQLGLDIDGEARGDKSGWSVSLSSDGSRVAIGAIANDGTGRYAGHVRIYDYDGTAWTQVGADIDGESADDYSGYSVNLSSDGSRLAIGAIGNGGTGFHAGHVRIYDYDGTAWTQVGADIDGEAAYDKSGYSVNLSSDGSHVAIGANDGSTGSNAGHVCVYDYNGMAWIQVGTDIDGESADDYSGHSVNLSSDGSRIAIGAYLNDGNGVDAGHVRIYDYNGTTWIQVGADIDGEAEYDRSGYSVNLSSDGSRIAIGATDNDGSGSNAGHVRVYDYNGTAWIQVGVDIDGEAAGDSSGHSVNLSSDGSRVAIGAINNDDTDSLAGQVRVYELKRNLIITPKADAQGTTTVTVTANDGVVETNTTFTLNIQSVNDVPTITIDSTLSTDEDNGQSLTFSLADVEDASLTLAVESNAINGVVSISGTDVSYTPNANYNGVDSFTLSTTDSDGAKVTKTITVTVASVNDIPIITIDSTLSTQEDGSSSLSFSVTDLDGDDVVATITVAPTYAVAVVDATTLTYTPTLNYNGTDRFTLTFNDGYGGVVTQIITVNVSSVNDEPTIFIGSTIVVNEDGSCSITFTFTFTFTYADVDGDIVSATLVQSPTNGFVQIQGSNMMYVPRTGFSGNDSFEIALSDSNGYVSMQTVNVAVLANIIEIAINPTNTNDIMSQVSVVNENNSTTQTTLFESDDAKITRVEVTLPKNAKATRLADDTVAYVVEVNSTKVVSMLKDDATVELVQLKTDENNQTKETKITSNRENIKTLVNADASLEIVSQMRVDENLTSSTKVTLRNDGTTLNEVIFTQSDDTNASLRIESNIVGMITELKADGTSYMRTPKKIAQDGSESEVTVEITPDGTLKQTLIVTKADGTQIVTPMINIAVNPMLMLDLQITEEADGSVTLKTKTLIPESGFTRER